MESGRLFFGCNSSNNMLFLGNGDNYFRGTSTMRSVLNMEETSKRRPFCSLLDDVLEEEYYDEQSPEKKRRLTPEQVHMLEKSFEEENKLEPERKTELAKKLGLQPRQVAVWFQNRRARWKTKQLERDYDLLKSSYDALVSDYDSIVKENDVLKAEVVSLTEKMQSKEVAKTPVISSGLKPELPREEYSGNATPSIPLGSIKVEDHLSTGSGGSAVVDDHDHDQDGPQLVDSGDSYLPDDHGYPDQYVAPAIDQSEEDDGSDDGQSYFSQVFAAAEHINHNEEELMGWCVWSVDV